MLEEYAVYHDESEIGVSGTEYSSCRQSRAIAYVAF
jgi:hypothetical protein